MRISDWSADVCSSDLVDRIAVEGFDKTQIGEVAVEPGGGALSRFLNRMNRKFQCDSARFANSFADALGQHQMMAVARRQVRPGLREDRKSTRLNPVTNAHLVCRLLLEKKNTNDRLTTVNSRDINDHKHDTHAHSD